MGVVKNILVGFVVVLSLQNFCEAENCDQYGVLIYEDMACRPVKAEEKSCPSKYDCDFAKPKSGGCLFKGKSYAPLEDIESDLTYSACSVGCRCQGFNSIICASLDCPEYLGFHRQPDTYLGYSVGKCCSTKQIHDSSDNKKCVVDGKTYKLGERFHPKDVCLSCVCHEEFTGAYDEKTCIRQNCNVQINYSSEVSRKCAPAYFKYDDSDASCCPSHFVCPESTDVIEIVNPTADKNSNLECSYGEKKLKLGEGLKKNVNKYGTDRNLQCECVIPPLLTCKEL